MKNNSYLLEKNSLSSLSDGIFAISITILILNITPNLAIDSVDQNTIILNLLKNLSNCFLGFFIIFSFWITHTHQIKYINKIDNGFLWISALELFLITLVPFSVSFINNHSELILSNIFFNLNFILIALIFFWKIFYIRRNISNKILTASQFEISRNIALMTVFISFCSLILSFFVLSYSNLIYLSLPFLVKKIKNYELNSSK